jgi:periplasmic divalent cation tolerance protein
MSDPVPALIWCPFPDRECAAGIAQTLLDDGLIACANMLGEIQSFFVWNGERGEATETGVLLKTNSLMLDAAITRLVELHPYDEPAILGWRCDATAPGTAAWLGALRP